MVDLKMVRVWWRDSCSFPTWRDSETVRTMTPDDIESVGFVVTDNADRLIITQSVSVSGNMDNALAIPRECISEIKELDYAVQKNRTKRVRKARK